MKNILKRKLDKSIKSITQFYHMIGQRTHLRANEKDDKCFLPIVCLYIVRCLLVDKRFGVQSKSLHGSAHTKNVTVFGPMSYIVLQLSMYMLYSLLRTLLSNVLSYSHLVKKGNKSYTRRFHSRESRTHFYFHLYFFNLKKLCK